jgi:hypothetical protein
VSKLSDHVAHNLLDLFFDGPRATFPPKDVLGWFGVALYDALAPLHGEPPLISEWYTLGQDLRLRSRPVPP